jgi:hypothetical protein
MAVDTPSHREWLIDLLEYVQLWHGPVTFQADDLLAGGTDLLPGLDVTGMGIVDVIGNFVDADPRNGLVPVVVAPQLLDLLRIAPTRQHGVTPHARGDGWNTRVHGPFRRKVAVLTVDAVITGMGAVGKPDRLGSGTTDGARAGFLGQGRRITSSSLGESESDERG